MNEEKRKEDKRLEELEEDWICDIVRHTYENYKGRKIILWGKYGVPERIARALDKVYHISIDGYIDSSSSKADGTCVRHTSEFFAQADKDEYYIVVPLALHMEVVEMLRQNGFEKDADYYYFSECILEQRKNYYEDTHGNKVIGDAGGVSIVFLGFHATVTIHERAVLPDSGKIYIHSNAGLEIGANTKMTFQSYIEIGRDAKVSIGADCLLRSIKYLYVKPYAQLWIGDETTTWYGCCINVCEWSKVKIGRDCMLSHDIKIYSNDCHTIFDLATGKNINSTEEICRQRNIFIGNHVWIGMNATILYGSEIGNGSIVGTESLVKGFVPENCIVCGNPARITRRNIAWSRKNCAENMEYGRMES